MSEELEDSKHIPFEVASKEVEKWLDYKRIRQFKRQSNQDAIDDMVASVSEGLLIINDDMTLTQPLLFPIEGTSTSTEKLEWKSRMTSKEVGDKLRGVNMKDSIAVTDAIIGAVTNQNSGIIGKLDTGSDKSLAQNIATFFF